MLMLSSIVFKNILLFSYGLLILASVITFLILQKSPSNPTLIKVKVIIKSWWLIVSFFLLTLGAAPWGLLLGFLFISILSLFELLRHSRLEKLKPTFAALVSASILSQYLAMAFGKDELFFSLPILFMFLGVAIIVVATGDYANFPKIFSTYAGAILIFHMLSYFPKLYFHWEKVVSSESAIVLVFLVLCLTELNDVFQFLSGKFFGKRKIIPLISPNKTEAGFLGGILMTSILGGFCFSSLIGVSFSRALLMGFVISSTGILGDLIFSAVKRYFGTKDFSEALPGHGGLLDRLDSLVYTTPSIYFFLTLSS